MMSKFLFYLSKKTKQLKNISWFLCGFTFGCGAFFLCIISLVLAILFDFLSVYLKDHIQP